MKKLLVAAIALTLAFLPVSLPASPTFPLAEVLPSVAKLTVRSPEGEGHCTAFSINEDRGVYMTAGHCLGEGSLYKLDGSPAMAIYDDDVEDLGVVMALSQRPALKLGSGVSVGELVGGIGYGLGTPAPLLQAGYVISLFLDPYDAGAERLILSTGLIPGMSGGPIVNVKGEVVSVVQMTGYPDHWFQNIGAGGVYSKVRELYGRYR